MRQVYVADSAVVGVVKFTAALVERDESKYAADGVLVAVMFGGDQIERDGIGHDSSTGCDNSEFEISGDLSGWLSITAPFFTLPSRYAHGKPICCRLCGRRVRCPLRRGHCFFAIGRPRLGASAC